jgi:hypothetical protein
MAGMLLACLGVAVAVALLRAVPRLLHDPAVRGAAFPLAGEQGDAMSHLVLIDVVRRHRRGIPRSADQFILGKRLDYPLLFHWVMSRLPCSVVERFDWLMSPLIEGVHAALMCAFAAWFLGRNGEQAAVAWAVVATLAAVSTPILSRAWRRAGFIGERSFGFLFGNAYLMAVIVLLDAPSWYLLVAAALAFTAAAASSKFALQAMVFISVAMAAVLFDWRPLAVLGVCFVAAILLSRGYLLSIARGLVRHSSLYRSALVRVSDATTSFSSRDLWTGLAAAARGKLRAARNSFRRHPIGRLHVQLPWVLPFAVLLAQLSADHTDAVVPVRLVLAFAGAALLVGVATTADRLKFVGEGERYLEYAALPMVLAVFLIDDSLGGKWWLLLAAVGAWRLVREARQAGLFRGPSAAAAELAGRMRELPPGLVFAIPGRLTLPVCYRTDHRAVWHLAHIDPGEATREWLDLFPAGSHYPFPHPSVLPGVVARYRPDYLVVWKSGTRATEAHRGFRYDLAHYPTLFGNEDYAVLDVSAARAGAPRCDLAAAQ